MATVSKETEVKNISSALAQPEGSPSLGKSVEAMTHGFGTRIGEMAHNVSDKATEYVGTTREYVKEHPIQSVAIAAATGAVIGSLVTLVARRKH